MTPRAGAQNPAEDVGMALFGSGSCHAESQARAAGAGGRSRAPRLRPPLTGVIGVEQNARPKRLVVSEERSLSIRSADKDPHAHFQLSSVMSGTD